MIKAADYDTGHCTICNVLASTSMKYLNELKNQCVMFDFTTVIWYKDEDWSVVFVSVQYC